MINLITNETIKRSAFSSLTFLVDCILSTLLLFIITNQKFIQVSCSKNLSFIQGTPIKCANEGQIIKVPFLPKDPCNISCKCVNGEVTCQRESCFGFQGGGGGSGMGGGGGVINTGGFGNAKASVFQNSGASGINFNAFRNKVNFNRQQQSTNNNNGFGVCKIDSNSFTRLSTFDGLPYKYIGRFNYVATRDCSKKIFSVHLVNTDQGNDSISSAPALPTSAAWSTNTIKEHHPLLNAIPNQHQLNYSIIKNHHLDHSSKLSPTKPSFNTIVVKIKGIKVRISQSTVKIGRKEINLPFVKLGVLSVIRDGSKIVVRSNIGIRVTWDRHETTQVFIPRAYKGKVCGLCGNFNGNPKDDLKTKRGLRATDISSFFNSWKVGRRRKTKDEIVLKLYQYNRSRTKKKIST